MNVAKLAHFVVLLCLNLASVVTFPRRRTVIGASARLMIGLLTTPEGRSSHEERAGARGFGLCDYSPCQKGETNIKFSLKFLFFIYFYADFRFITDKVQANVFCSI